MKKSDVEAARKKTPKEGRDVYAMWTSTAKEEQGQKC